ERVCFLAGVVCPYNRVIRIAAGVEHFPDFDARLLAFGGATANRRAARRPVTGCISQRRGGPDDAPADWLRPPSGQFPSCNECPARLRNREHARYGAR